jgi:hypothetical protein
MVKARAGAGRLGCLVGLLLLVTIVYFGFNIGEVYFRYYRLKDAMEQEVRFAETRDDAAIRSHMKSVADSLGLPEAAGRVSIERTNTRVVISSDYSEHVELPMFVREFHFKPRAVR